MNNESIVFSGLAGLLRTSVLTPICTYLQTRQQQGPITTDELANLLKLPSSAPPPAPAANFAPMPSSFPGMAGVPPTLTGFAGMPMPLSAQKKSGGKSSGQPAAEHERCIYQISRGANRGSRCASKVEAGLQYCKQHKTTRRAQETMQGGAPMGGPVMPGMPGIAALPGLSGAPMMPTVQPQKPQLTVHLVAPGLYREGNQGLAIKAGATPNEYIACGVFTDLKSNTVSPLTPDKIEYCRQIGLAYVDPSNPGESTAKPSANVSGQTFPMMTQQLPTLPSTLPSMGLPSMMSGLPSMTDLHGSDDPIDDDIDEDEDI